MKRLLALAIVLTTVEAHASHEYVEQVLQPLETNCCLIVADVAYICAGAAWETPGSQLLRTCSPNVISDGVSSKNRNAANLAGIRLILEPGKPDATTHLVYPGLSGDTLRVRVDLSSTSVSTSDSSVEAHALPFPVEELVPLTLKCGLLNARRRWPRVRFVAYTVEGNPEFLFLSGTYALEELSSPPTPFQDLEPLVPAAK